jgi:hypothetical protein
MRRTCSTHEMDEKCIRNFGPKTEGKRPFGRPRRKWEDSIRLYLIELGCEGVDQWRALVNTVMNLRALLKMGNFLNR